MKILCDNNMFKKTGWNAQHNFNVVKACDGKISLQRDNIITWHHMHIGFGCSQHELQMRAQQHDMRNAIRQHAGCYIRKALFKATNTAHHTYYTYGLAYYITLVLYVMLMLI